MKKIFFLITFFLSLHSTFFSQERKVRKAIKYLVEEKFQECLNLNLELLDEYPNLPLGYFVMFKYYFSKKNPNFNLEKSYEFILKTEKVSKNNEFNKEWCENFELCTESLSKFKDSISNQAFNFLESNQTEESFNSFLRTYNNTLYYKKGLELYSEWSYNNIVNSHDVKVLDDFLLKFPDSKHTKILLGKVNLMKMDSVSVTCIGSNNIDSLKLQCRNKINDILLSMLFTDESFSNNSDEVLNFLDKIPEKEILNYIITSEFRLENSKTELTMCAKFRLDLISNFLNKNGIKTSLNKSSFKYVVSNQINKEKQELKIIYDIVGSFCESIQTGFDYKISTGQPIKTNLENLNWKIPIKVSVTRNQIFNSSYQLFLDALNQLSVTNQEVIEYNKYSKKTFKVSVNTEGKAKEFILRNRNSLKVIELFFNNYLNYLSSFYLKTELDSINGLDIYKYDLNGVDYNRVVDDDNYRGGTYHFFNSEFVTQSFVQSNYSYAPLENKEVNQQIFNDFNQTVVNISYQPLIEAYFEGYRKRKNLYADELRISSITLNNLLTLDTLASFQFYKYVSLDDLKKINSFSVSSNGLIFKYLNKCLYNEEKLNFKLPLNYINQIEYRDIDSLFNFHPFNGGNLHVADEFEIEEIFKNKYFKLLPIPKGHFWYVDRGEDYCRHYYDLDERKAFFESVYKESYGGLVRKLLFDCDEKFDLNNVLLVEDFKKEINSNLPLESLSVENTFASTPFVSGDEFQINYINKFSDKCSKKTTEKRKNLYTPNKIDNIHTYYWGKSFITTHENNYLEYAEINDQNITLNRNINVGQTLHSICSKLNIIYKKDKLYDFISLKSINCSNCEIIFYFKNNLLVKVVYYPYTG